MNWANPLSWPVEPVVLLALELAIILYVRGGFPRAGPRPTGWGSGEWRALAFGGGLLVIFLALDSPVEFYARTLFWVHMTQHLLLITVGAPLLVVAGPGLRMWRGLPLRLRRPVARALVRHPLTRALRAAFRWLSAPAVVWVLSALNLWLWHLPPAYDLTLRNHLVHHVEHTLFLGLGLLFWAQVIDQPPFRVVYGQFQRTMYVFTATIAAWALAAVLGLASTAFYAYAALPSRPGGISALTDQQIGAGIMWVPGSITYSIVMVWCLALWLRDEERLAAREAVARIDGAAAR